MASRPASSTWPSPSSWPTSSRRGWPVCATRPTPSRAPVGEQDPPSLRYLELYLTERCNLRCGHCFLGDLGRTDLPPATTFRLLDQFDAMGGLRLLLTGGEAILHPAFWHVNETTGRAGLPHRAALERHPPGRRGCPAAGARSAGEPGRVGGRTRPAARPGNVRPRRARAAGRCRRAWMSAWPPR